MRHLALSSFRASQAPSRPSLLRTVTLSPLPLLRLHTGSHGVRRVQWYMGHAAAGHCEGAGSPHPGIGIFSPEWHFRSPPSPLPPVACTQVDMGSDKSNGIWDMLQMVIVGVLGTAASGYFLSPFTSDEFGFNAARKAIDQVRQGRVKVVTYIGPGGRCS